MALIQIPANAAASNWMKKTIMDVPPPVRLDVLPQAGKLIRESAAAVIPPAAWIVACRSKTRPISPSRLCRNDERTSLLRQPKTTIRLFRPTRIGIVRIPDSRLQEAVLPACEKRVAP